MNPTSHDESCISVVTTKGLSIGVILGKALVNNSVRPLFNDARILIILRNPSSVRCYFLPIKTAICLNNSKSARF